MPNLYNKLMAKDMPGAAPAPTSRQMVQAPMGLRSAMKRYAEGGETPPPPPEEERMRLRLREMETMRPPEEPRLREMETMRPPEPRYEEPRYPEEETTRPPRVSPPDMPTEQRPDIYPEDYTGPRVTGTTQPRVQGRGTSYRQEADGTLTEIGYNGQPISGYTPEQMAMHKATMGIDQPKFSYVWNGAGYDKVQVGYSPDQMLEIEQQFQESLGQEQARRNEEQFQESLRREAAERQRQTTAPMPMPETMPQYYPTTAPMPDTATMPEEPQNNYDNQPMLNPQLELLRRALQGAGSKGNSQQLASLLQMLGYSK